MFDSSSCMFCAALSASVPSSKSCKMPPDFVSMLWLTGQGQAVMCASWSAADLTTGHAEKDTVSMPILKWWGVICLSMPSTLPFGILQSILCKSSNFWEQLGPHQQSYRTTGSTIWSSAGSEQDWHLSTKARKQIALVLHMTKTHSDWFALLHPSRLYTFA